MFVAKRSDRLAHYSCDLLVFDAFLMVLVAMDDDSDGCGGGGGGLLLGVVMKVANPLIKQN